MDAYSSYNTNPYVKDDQEAIGFITDGVTYWYNIMLQLKECKCNL